MNPFTHFLARQLRPRQLQALIDYWDTLEALIIQVYKTHSATAADEADYRRVRAWLQRYYPTWEEALRPHWQKAQVGGRPADHDPFQRLIAPESVAAFVTDWEAMQTLPAAREALNRLILAQTALSSEQPDVSS